jgi:3-deoxy-D-manno-octulosonic-acid transferase
MPALLDAIYLLLLAAAFPWLAWNAWRNGKYRAGLGAKFLGLVPRLPHNERTRVWLHGVSVGEVQLLAPLLAHIAQRHPDWECVISTTTRTGLAVARKKYPRHVVFYCPLDFTWSVRRAMRRVRPQLLVLIELELWPNLVRAAQRAGARVAVINGRLSDHSARGYRRIGFVMRRTAAALDLVAAQSATYAQRFETLGARPERVHVTGSIKFDNVETQRANRRTCELAERAGLRPGDIVFLAGSTQDPEESLALAAFRALAGKHPRLKLILVPRHPERFPAVEALLDACGQPWQRRSSLESVAPDPTARILLVDTVGELAAWWGTAHIAYVGGSMGHRGGQNMIEPAAFGAAVSFGPHTHNFRDVVGLLCEHDAAIVVRDGAELQAFVAGCLEDPAHTDELGRRAQRLVAQQRGATERTLELLTALLPSGASRVQAA